MLTTPDAAPRPLPPVVLRGFSAIPSSLVADPGISNAELRVLLALVAHAGPDNRCWPGVARVARIVHVGERQARRILKDLVAKGYVEKKLRRRDDGACTSNAYRLRFARWGGEGGEGDGTETPGDKPGGNGAESVDQAEDLDKNARGAGNEAQGAPVMNDPLTLSIEPGQEGQTPQSPPRTGGAPVDRVSVVQEPSAAPEGSLRLTRTEQKRLEVLEQALAEKASCADCGNRIRPVRGRDHFGRFAPGVALHLARTDADGLRLPSGFVHTGCIAQPPTVYRLSRKVGRDGFSRGRLVIES